MTHDELREKVARALWATRNPPYLFEAVSGDELIDLMAEADAALAAVREALREPDRKMEDAAMLRPANWPVTDNTMYPDIWRAMLAASPLAEPRA